MRIFVVPSWYKTDKYPENCIFIYEQVQALRELGHQTVVLSVQPRLPLRPGRYERFQHVNDHGVDTHYDEIVAVKPSKLRAVFIRGFRKSLDGLVRDAIETYGMPDVLYAHFSFAAGNAAVAISKKYGVPLVVEEHYSGLMQAQVDRPLLRCVRQTVENCQGFVCVSEGLRSSIAQKVGNYPHMTVVSNMIAPCFVYTEPVKKPDFVFFACGYLIPRKGFDLLIRAFCQEFSPSEPVKLRIGGTGEQEPALRQMVLEGNRAEDVRFLGKLSREQTVREYAYADAFTLASRAETYGLVYREALAVGRPVVSTRHGGFSDRDWHDEYGVLVEIDDLDALKKALRWVYENYQKYDLRKISDLCLRDCSGAAVARELTAVFAGAKERFRETENG